MQEREEDIAAMRELEETKRQRMKGRERGREIESEREKERERERERRNLCEHLFKGVPLSKSVSSRQRFKKETSKKLFSFYFSASNGLIF